MAEQETVSSTRPVAQLSLPLVGNVDCLGRPHRRQPGGSWQKYELAAVQHGIHSGGGECGTRRGRAQPPCPNQEIGPRRAGRQMKTRPPKMVTLRPGGRIVPQWYWLTAFELFGAGVVLLIVGLVRMHGVGEIVLGGNHSAVRSEPCRPLTSRFAKPPGSCLTLRHGSRCGTGRQCHRRERSAPW